MADGPLTPLTHRAGPDQEPVPSPDGQLIAYTGYDERGRGLENMQLHVMRRDGTQPMALTLDRLVSSPHWAADGRSLYVSYDEHGVGLVARLDLNGRVLSTVANVGDGNFSINRDGTLGFAQTAPDHPAEVAVASPKGRVRRLTQLNTELLARRRVGRVRPLAVRSSFDGLAVGAWALTPPGYDLARHYPTILSIPTCAVNSSLF